MRATLPLYEGDSLIHYGAARTDVSAPSSGMPIGHPAFDRSAARGPLARLIDWLIRGIERAHYRELERYLADSTDLCDLERRIRDFERRRQSIFDPYG